MKWLRRLILLLLALFVIWAWAVNDPFHNIAVKPAQSSPGNLQEVQRKLEDSLRQQRQIENMVRREQWRMQHPNLPDSYNPSNYYVP